MVDRDFIEASGGPQPVGPEEEFVVAEEFALSLDAEEDVGHLESNLTSMLVLLLDAGVEEFVRLLCTEGEDKLLDVREEPLIKSQKPIRWQ